MKKILGKITKSLWIRLLGILLLFVLLAGILISAFVAWGYDTEGYYEEVDMKEKFAYSAAANAIANHYMDEIYEERMKKFPSSGVCIADVDAIDQYLGDKNVDCRIIQIRNTGGQVEKNVLYDAWVGNDRYPEWERSYSLDKNKSNTVVLTMQMKLDWEHEDWLYDSYVTYRGDYENRYVPMVTGGAALILFVLVLRYLVLQRNGKAMKEHIKEVAARKEERGTKWIPLDLAAIVWLLSLWITIYYTDFFADEIISRFGQGWYVASLWDEAYRAIIWTVWTLVFFLFLLWMFVVRKRSKTLTKGLIFVKGRNGVKKFRKTLESWIGGRIPLCVMITLRFLMLAFLEFMLVIIIVACNGDEEAWMFWFVLIHGLLLLVAARRGFQKQKIQEGAEAIARGDFSYQIKIKGMTGERLELAENLNRIGEGMAQAVEESIRSERMKTELITNVSHDIKTPLTSIINYVDLLQKEHTKEQEKEYLEVLVRQSARLKKLTEDVLVASKAASGNVEVHLVPMSLGEVLNQAAAEYEERLAGLDLKLVWKLPEQELRILADGAMMWRVLDNLFGNICKYSLRGSRVYVSAEQWMDQAVVTLKNISAEELTVSAEELLERFVRGDQSRTTEGSGLGLNIASSFIELQGGLLELELDGDLFKVKLMVPVTEEELPSQE